MQTHHRSNSIHYKTAKCIQIMANYQFAMHRKRGMRRFKSTQQAQRFLSTHAAVYNLFNLGRHLVSAKHYRLFRENAFASWKCAVAL